MVGGSTLSPSLSLLPCPFLRIKSVPLFSLSSISFKFQLQTIFSELLEEIPRKNSYPQNQNPSSSTSKLQISAITEEMGRLPCCEKSHTNKGAWTKEEDHRLVQHIRRHGEGCWRSLPTAAGLLRCGKSCRLRWINYLRPDLKRGNFSDEETELIIKLHSLLGNKWSLIAGRLPGRTDNEIKNYWNTHIKRKLINHDLDPKTHRPIHETVAIRSSPPLTPVAELPVIKKRKKKQVCNTKMQSMESKNTIRDKNEEGNVSSSVTTCTEIKHEMMDLTEINLELSIGPTAVHGEAPGASSENSIESKLRQSSPMQWSMVGERICLCCKLGFQSCKRCMNCGNSDKFLRY